MLFLKWNIKFLCRYLELEETQSIAVEIFSWIVQNISPSSLNSVAQYICLAICRATSGNTYTEQFRRLLNDMYSLMDGNSRQYWLVCFSNSISDGRAKEAVLNDDLHIRIVLMTTALEHHIVIPHILKNINERVLESYTRGLSCFDAFKIALLKYHVESEAEMALFGELRHNLIVTSGGNVSETQKYSSSSAYQFILDYLYNSFFSDSQVIAEIAFKVFCVFSSSPDVAPAYKQMPSAIQECTRPFKKEGVVKTPLDKQIFDCDWHESIPNEVWLANLIYGMIDTFLAEESVSLLKPMVSVDHRFSIAILPHLFVLVLYNQSIIKQHAVRILTKKINSFFSNVMENDIFIVKTLLRSIYFVEEQNPDPSRPILDLDCTCLANLSIEYGYYCECLAWIERRTITHGLVERGSIGGLLMKIYDGIGDDDGYEGALTLLEIGKMPIAELSLEIAMHEKKWNSVWKRQDALLQTNPQASNDTLLRSMASSNSFSTLELASRNQRFPNENDDGYHALWRLSRWSNLDIMDGSAPNYTHNQAIFRFLKAFELSSSDSALRNGLDRHIGMISDHLVTNADYINNAMYLEIFEALHFHLDKSEEAQWLICRWDQRILAIKELLTFAQLQSLYYMRSQLLWTMVCGNSDVPASPLAQYFERHIQMLFNTAIIESDEICARNSLAIMKKMVGGSIAYSDLLQFDCSVEWTFGEKKIALKYLKTLIGSPELSNDRLISVLHKCGKWSMELKVESPLVIMGEYLLRATAMAIKANHDIGNYAFDLALYSDQIFSDSSGRYHTRSRQELLIQQQELVQLRTISRNQTDSTSRYLNRMQTQVTAELLELDKIEAEMDMYLVYAIENYLLSLSHWDSNLELSILRVCSLWLSHTENTRVNAIVDKMYRKIPSRHFLVVFYQLLAVLVGRSDHESQFCRLLLSLLEGPIVEYPYHTLMFIIGLKNGSGSQTMIETLLKRVALPKIVVEIELLFEGYINLANCAIPGKGARSKSFEIKRSSLLLQEYVNIPVLTANQPVSRQRSDYIFTEKIENRYSLAGGIILLSRNSCP